MDSTLRELVDCIVGSNVVERQDVEDILESVEAETGPVSAEQLLGRLVERRLLTRFQADRLGAGDAGSLWLGGYEILEKIGEGGMGQVFRARHRQLDRTVAIKLLSPRVSGDPDALLRFQREVEASAQLEHPNIVAAYDADEADGVHFLVMQYVPGEDLNHVVRNRGTFDVASGVECVLQAATGLAYAHDRGVVHRDIKPANMLLDETGVVKILDMGLARIDSPGTEAGLTGTGLIMGTVDYMAPEQARDTRSADARADVYALGISLWFLLTGRPAYGGATVVEKLMAHQSQPIPSLARRVPGVPTGLEECFRTMVAKAPDDRFQSMQQVIESLQAFSEGEAIRIPDGGGVAELPAGSETYWSGSGEDDPEFASTVLTPADLPSSARSPEARRRIGPWLAGFALLLLLALATAGGVAATVWMQPAPSPPRDVTVAIDDPAAIGAVVRIDDALSYTIESVGTRRLLAAEDAERLTVRVEKPGYEPFEQTVDVLADDRIVRVQLVPAVVKADEAVLLTAPFSGSEAEFGQRAWAAKLGASVYERVALPNGEFVEFALIPPGEYMMGGMNEVQAREVLASGVTVGPESVEVREDTLPRHRVRITRPFWMSRYETTLGQYRQFVNATGYVSEIRSNNIGGFGSKDGKWVRDPEFYWDNMGPDVRDEAVAVTNLSYTDSVEFCRWIGERSGLGTGTLPTEAQWEYACRAGAALTLWTFGNDESKLVDFAKYEKNRASPKRTVGQYLPNALGLYDIHGNVSEWCLDWYAKDYYAESPVDDPPGPETGIRRVRRGGALPYDADMARCSRRENYRPGMCLSSLGFRAVILVAE